MLCILLILQLILWTPIDATPAFNEVNNYDLQGHRCPLPTYQSYPCPMLCVPDLSLCPPNMRPSLGQSGPCGDHAYFCLPQRVKIFDFVAENKTNLAFDQCAQAIMAASPLIQSIRPWSPDVRQPMWGPIDNGAPLPLTYTEPVFLALYGFYGACLILLFVWLFYKSIYEKTIKKRTLGMVTVESSVESKELGMKSKDEEEENDDNDDDNLVIRAYRRSLLGDSMACLFILETLGQVGYMIMMTNDYYTGYALFNQNAVIQSSTFMAMWYLFFFWFSALTIFRSRLANFFRLQCPYGKGDYVQIERQQQDVIFLQGHSNKIMDTVRGLELWAKHLVGLDWLVTTVPLKRTKSGTVYFIYQCTRYVYQSGRFVPHTFNLGYSSADLVKLSHGLDEVEAGRREELIGANFIQVHVPNFLVGLLLEFSSFFYIYQFTVLWLFYYYAYWQVGIADTCVIIISAIVKVVVRLRSENRIKTMAEFTDEVTILRDGTWQCRSTADLIPGDVFQLESGRCMPCDAVILEGQVVVDESSLTGEPLPIRKFPLRADDTTRYDRSGSGKISTLFAGTTLSSVQSSTTLALATQTGTATDKGQLIKKILFPSQVSFVFDEQIKIVILILLCCGLVVLGLAIWLYAKGTSAWFYAMFAISQLVSPLLPAALVVGQSVASGRLREKQIYCVDLPRILMAGKVQIFCFDKTGTLTKEGLEFYGTQAMSTSKETPHLDTLVHEMALVPRSMQIGLATCHAVTTLNGQFIGNPVDIEMFKSSQWTLAAQSDHVDTLIPPCGSSPVHVLQRFEFVHARMSMSVAVLDSATNKIHIFVKGAYEKIKDLSIPSSIPDDYDQTTADLARQGCYVLALSHREIDLNKVGMAALKQWTRDQMEEEIEFMGLIVFKNQLKPDTTEQIGHLKAGATRTVMITGDTALTGVYIARQCGMALAGSRILLGDSDGTRIRWTDVDGADDKELDVDAYLEKGVELAVTGKAFQWLVDHDLIRKYLLDIRVYARMTPSGKVQCVQLHMERGITAMTGDGGNDCGALRAAHVGLAMSDAEASIVSPFSTSLRSVKSCVELVRQGRAALATSITGYKYLILYGQVMMMLKIFTFYFSVSLAQNIWIAVDVFITVLLTWAVSQSQPAATLAPQRPTAQLLGPQVLASTIGVVIINWVFLIGAFAMLYQQSWFRCNEFDSRAADMSKWWLLADSYEAQVLALVCVFQFINNAAVQNWGHHFRQSFHRNYILVGLWLIYFALASFWCLADPNWFGCLFRFNCGSQDVLAGMGYIVPHVEDYNTPLGHNVMPVDFRWKLWGLVVGNMVAALAWERGVILGPIRHYLAKTFPVQRLTIVH
ncbi:hypothetical protein BC941DRAFT_512000 [Chlamydoabsidia padenii]|nr:hypothetical protein BC941DRAFT_512000 [Chlamydoabsidia padenii]